MLVYNPDQTQASVACCGVRSSVSECDGCRCWCGVCVSLCLPLPRAFSGYGGGAHMFNCCGYVWNMEKVALPNKGPGKTFLLLFSLRHKHLYLIYLSSAEFLVFNNHLEKGWCLFWKGFALLLPLLESWCQYPVGTK